MQSKKFRNEQFRKGDLVAPNWNAKQPMGLGIILDTQFNSWHDNAITVYWQLIGETKESPVDLKLLEQAVD